VRAQLVVSLARLGLQALEIVVHDVTEHPKLLAAVHASFRTAHPERSDCVGEEQFPVPAFGSVVRVDPHRAVVSHPRDELLVFDADYAFKLRNLRDQRYGVANKAERLANEGTERLVKDEQRLASTI